MQKARKGKYSRWFGIRKIGHKALRERSVGSQLQSGCRVASSGEVVEIIKLGFKQMCYRFCYCPTLSYQKRTADTTADWSRERNKREELGKKHALARLM